MCLYCYHFTVSDLGLSLPSVCCKETGPHRVSLPCLAYSICTVPLHIMSFFFSFFLFFLLHPFSFLCVYLLVSPVLTPPESEKADSEDRVSLKVCVSIFSLSPCQAFFLVKKIMFTTPLSLHRTVFLPLDAEKSGGSLHPHLCGTLQVSASREERLGTTVG